MNAYASMMLKEGLDLLLYWAYRQNRPCVWRLI